MIHRHVFHNDKLVPIEEMRLSAGQSGLLSGWGLFTTLRIFEGQPFAYEKHWRRLEKDAGRTAIPFPYDREIVREQLMQVLRANQVREGCARIYLVYNTAGFWRSEEPLPDVDLIIYSADLPGYREPARLGVAAHGRHAASPLAGTKVTSWLVNVWNLKQAQQAGWDEVVLLNERGEVAECTAANIFCVQAGTIYTPPLSSGCLEGITRSTLLEIGAAAGAPVEEKTLFPEDLYRADEVFISSTNRSVLAVGEVHDHKLPAAPGPVTRRVEIAFARYVTEYVARRTASARG
jgi:branched-chain amino acid aminotransferase